MSVSIEQSVLNLKRGDTGKWTSITVDTATEQALDFTGCSFRMAVWATTPEATVTTDAGAEFVLTSPSGGIVVSNATSGELTITISKSQSAALTQELYGFDLQLTTPSSEEYSIAEGVLQIEPQFTHST